jgi:hypothetical protein
MLPPRVESENVTYIIGMMAVHVDAAFPNLAKEA